MAYPFPSEAWLQVLVEVLNSDERYAEVARGPHGAPLCDLVMNCVKACPKGVAPGGAIRKMKES